MTPEELEILFAPKLSVHDKKVLAEIESRKLEFQKEIEAAEQEVMDTIKVQQALLEKQCFGKPPQEKIETISKEELLENLKKQFEETQAKHPNIVIMS